MPTIARTITTAVVLALAAAAPATADPFTLGPSDNLRDAPDLAVDNAGTAHVVYPESRESIRYCRLPRGARSCASEARFPIPDGFSAAVGPQLAIGDPNRVVVAFHGLSSDPRNSVIVTFAAVSNDGGATFAPPAEVGTGQAHDVVLGPGNSLTGPTFPNAPESVDIEYLDHPLGGGAGGSATLGPRGPEAHETAPGMHVALAGGAPVITWNKRFGGREPALADELWAARWSGAGSIRDASTWSAPFRVAGAGDNSVTAGPSGVFAGYTRQSDDSDLSGPSHVLVSRLDGTTVAEPRQAAAYAIRGIDREGQSTVFGGVTQDPSGRLTAIWSQDGRRIRRGRGRPTTASTVSTATSASGTRWAKPAAIACETGAIRSPRAGTAPDGGGFAVYTQASGSRGGSEVRAAPIGLGERGATCGIEPDGRVYNEFGSSRVLITRGRFAFTIGCADGHLRCKGTGQLKSGRQTIGTRAYSLDPAASRGWVFRLNRAGRSALARRGRLRVRAVFPTRGGPTTTIPLTIVENRGRATR
jgi:hypothetical protein